MKLWEVIEYTPAKVSGIVLFENSTSKGGLKHKFFTLNTKIVHIITGRKGKNEKRFFWSFNGGPEPGLGLEMINGLCM